MSTLNLPPYRDPEDSDKYDTKPLPPRFLYPLDDDNHSEQMKDHLEGLDYGHAPSRGSRRLRLHNYIYSGAQTR